VRNVGYVAIDDGPRRTLAALQSHLPGPWLDAKRCDWGGSLRAQDIELLICGTSDSEQGREAEAGARRAAHALGVPAVVIEDFPGNFAAMSTPPRLLCVESEFAAALARRQMSALAVHVGPAIRYDALRRASTALRREEHSADAVLWIGQPETSDALRTLEELLPALQARGARLWFRAHPRDAGYAAGEYARFLGRAGEIEDVTRLPLEECLKRRPGLAITQFSSLAIEAGFWGIPALNVLFTDVGGRTLAARKGYAVPPWCEAGAAFLILRAQEMDKVLDRALGSAEARRGVMDAFDEYFSVGTEGAPALINLLYNQGLL